MTKYSSFKQQQLITESWRSYTNNNRLEEGLDLNSIKNAITAIAKYVPDITKIAAKLALEFKNIIKAVSYLARVDNGQNITNLTEAKKPILLPFFNEYGLLIGSIAMAIIALTGTPSEPLSPQLIKMIQLGIQGKTAADFFSSLSGFDGAELAVDLYGGVVTETTKYDDAHLDDGTLVCAGCLQELLESQRTIIQEAKYQGRTVTLNKPTKGDVKKFKVYVKDPTTGNVKKVNFGDPNMKIKKNIPARRKSFRARHNCANPGPKTKARYWSCKKW